MNYLSNQFTSIEEGMTALKKAVKLRDSMGGIMYWNALNDDCCSIANTLSGMRADKKEISAILGKETHNV